MAIHEGGLRAEDAVNDVHVLDTFSVTRKSAGGERTTVHKGPGPSVAPVRHVARTTGVPNVRPTGRNQGLAHTDRVVAAWKQSVATVRPRSRYGGRRRPGLGAGLGLRQR